MTSDTDVIARWVETELAKGRPRALAPDTNLLDLGIVDSVAIVRLLAFLEERFGVRLDGEDVVSDNFCTIEAMAALVARRRTGTTAA
jgi:acyl carrier protein